MATETLAGSRTQPFAEEDIGNIVLMEHVNVTQPDQLTATLFYLVGMGFTRDPHMMVGLENMWVNVGEQQFHLPTNPPQVLRGRIGIVTPSLEALAERLEAVRPKLEGTKFSWTRGDGYIDATCPWGNSFRCHEPSPQFGGISLGIPYIEFTAPRGSAEGIALFYDRVFRAPARLEEDSSGRAAVVSIGQYQSLIFRETDNIPAYDGHHIAVYVAGFSEPYNWLAQRGLITEEPRNHQFRFVDIVHPESGEKLFAIEHEVRGMRHALYRRPLVNRIIGQFPEPRRVGGTTVMGNVM